MISRSFLAAVCLATSSFAAPPLTTIQDVLFKADGTRFHGTLSISWTSFEAIDQSAIAQQTTTVTVVNGNLQVQLVPTTTATPAAFYTVVYNSDGFVQFQTLEAPIRASSVSERVFKLELKGGGELHPAHRAAACQSSNLARTRTLNVAVRGTQVGVVEHVGRIGTQRERELLRDPEALGDGQVLLNKVWTKQGVDGVVAEGIGSRNQKRLADPSYKPLVPVPLRSGIRISGTEVRAVVGALIRLAALRSVILQRRREAKTGVISRDAAEGPAAHDSVNRLAHAGAKSLAMTVGNLVGLRQGDLAAWDGVAVPVARGTVVEEVVVGVIGPAAAPLSLIGVTPLQSPTLQCLDLHGRLQRVVALVGAIAVVGEVVGPPELGIVGPVQVRVGNPGNEDGFVGVDALAGAQESVPVRVADIGSRSSNLVGQLALESDVVLVRGGQRDLVGPELGIDAGGERVGPVGTDDDGRQSGRSLSECEHVGKPVGRLHTLVGEHGRVLRDVMAEVRPKHPQIIEIGRAHV